MFDWIRNLGKSAEEKRQEALTAYLDNALTPAQRQAFERELAQDAGLRATIEQHRLLKAQLRQLPRVAAPRHFTLDPAVYGQQRPATTMGSYTILRTATALVAFFFVLALVVDFASTGNRPPMVAMEEAAPAAEQSSGGVFTESVVQEEVQAETADEEEAAEEPAEDVAEVEPTEAAEELMDETAEDAAADAPGEVDDSASPLVTASPTPQPTSTVVAAGTQTQEPSLLAPEPTLALMPSTAAGAGPRPTLSPTAAGRDAVATIPPVTLDADTANTAAATPAPPIVPVTESGEPLSTFRIVQFALGGLFLVLLTLTLLVRRRA